VQEPVKRETKLIANLFISFFKWVSIAGITGILGGLVGSLFYLAVVQSTSFRTSHPWMIWLLPVGGILIALIYKFADMEQTNTDTIIDSIHNGGPISLLLLPCIFLATIITHIGGGSAGREGAALQIGGSIGSNIGRLFRLDDKDLRLATLCGMAGVFSALFGTPVTATLFSLEVISVGIFYYSGLVPCLVSAVVALGVTTLFGFSPTHFDIMIEPLTADLLWRVAVLAVFCAITSTFFCFLMHKTTETAEAKLKKPMVRTAVGGLIVVALTLLLHTQDYNGLGFEVILRAVEEGTAAPSAFFWKIIFTCATLAFGFKGGEIVPTFFIGATMGCILGPLLGIPASFAAAIGLIAVFCGAVNCPIASFALSIELFGSTELVYFALACGISYMLSGYYGLYHSQKIMYSKTRAEFINIQAK